VAELVRQNGSRGLSDTGDGAVLGCSASDQRANLTAMPLAAKYTQPQREAMAAAFELPHLTGRDVVELAAAGLLMHPTGAMLGPFTATQSTVRSEARRARRRREREAANTRLAELPRREAVELLYHQLVDMTEVERDRLQIEQAEERPIRGEPLRQLIRATRELTWLAMELDDPHPQPPGAKRNGIRHGGETRGGLAGQIFRASAEHAHQAPRTPVAIDHDDSRNGG
jgi:hypothetical protein